MVVLVHIGGFITPEIDAIRAICDRRGIVLAPRWLGRVLSTTLHGETPAELRLIWRTKPKDQKIRVHVTHCVLALMTARLMVREAARADLTMSVRELLSTEETVLLYQGDRGRPRARRMPTEMTPTQERLNDLFGLEAYAPTR